MNTSTIAIAEDTLSVCSVFIFVILFIMIHAALEQSKMFSGRIIGVLSFCVTSLSMIAMGMMFVSPQTSGDRPVSTESTGMPAILIPYAALGVSLLIMFLLMSLGKLFGSGKTGKPVEEIYPPELIFPSKQKTKPFLPIDLLVNLNKQSRPKAPFNPDYLSQTLRNISSIEQMKPKPKPPTSKGIRYEK
jgi:hypothetical protein